MRITGQAPDHILQKMSAEDRKAIGQQTSEESNAKFERKNEAKLHRDIMGKWASLNGVTMGHSQMNKKSTMPIGWPDFVFAWRGRPCAWEAKAPGCKPRPEQYAMLAQLEKDGWVTGWGDSFAVFVDWVNAIPDPRAGMITYDELIRAGMITYDELMSIPTATELRMMGGEKSMMGIITKGDK